ncbi:unnamed protein product, partial [Brenthis ino]
MFRIAVTDLDSPKYLSILNITKADKNTTLTCKAKNEEGYDEKSVVLEGKPEPVISWSYKKNYSSTEFEDLVTERDNVLHFKQVEIEHSGVYRCIAKNDLAYDKFEIEVVVEYIKIEYKKSKELKCKIDAYPPAQISWYRNNKKLSNNEDLEITPDNITLRIKQMQPYLKGKYYVEISNKFKTEKILFNVFIVGAVSDI